MYRKAGQFVTNKYAAIAARDTDAEDSTDALTITRRRSLVGEQQTQRKRHRVTQGVPRGVDVLQAT